MSETMQLGEVLYKQKWMYKLLGIGHTLQKHRSRGRMGKDYQMVIRWKVIEFNNIMKMIYEGELTSGKHNIGSIGSDERYCNGRICQG